MGHIRMGVSHLGEKPKFQKETAASAAAAGKERRAPMLIPCLSSSLELTSALNPPCFRDCSVYQPVEDRKKNHWQQTHH